MQKSAPRGHNACSIRIRQLLGVGALDGFATTADAWRRLLVERNLDSSCALFLQAVEGVMNQAEPISIFLCGDVMTGRGIDQVLPHPGNPVLYESYVRDARDYVELAEIAHGPIPKPAPFDYIWGDALEELDRARTDVRIINLETAITESEDYWPDKPALYRMRPRNIGCLTAARRDCAARDRLPRPCRSGKRA